MKAKSIRRAIVYTLGAPLVYAGTLIAATVFFLPGYIAMARTGKPWADFWSENEPK